MHSPRSKRKYGPGCSIRDFSCGMRGTMESALLFHKNLGGHSLAHRILGVCVCACTHYVGLCNTCWPSNVLKVMSALSNRDLRFTASCVA